MGEPTPLIGYILEGFHPRGREYVSQWNDRVLSELPETAEVFPPLIRSMFAVARADQRLACRYGERLITFGFHGKELHCSLDRWLPKFEELLRRVYWSEAWVHVNAAYLGMFTVTYKYDSTELDRFGRAEDPPPMQTWEFRCDVTEGGDSREVLAQLAKRPGFTDDRGYSEVPDRVRVQRMLDTARLAREVLRGHTRADLDADPVFYRALVRLYEEIMMDANRVGSEARRRVPSIGWSFMPSYYAFNAHEYWPLPDDPIWKRHRDELWGYVRQLPTFIRILQDRTRDWPMPPHPGRRS